jgi:hypothetical protein
MAADNQPCDKVHLKFEGTAMAGMLESFRWLIIDSLDDGSLV